MNVVPINLETNMEMNVSIHPHYYFFINLMYEGKELHLCVFNK